MVKAVLPTPPSPSTTNLYRVIFPAILGAVAKPACWKPIDQLESEAKRFWGYKAERHGGRVIKRLAPMRCMFRVVLLGLRCVMSVEECGEVLGSYSEQRSCRCTAAPMYVVIQGDRVNRSTKAVTLAS